MEKPIERAFLNPKSPATFILDMFERGTRDPASVKRAELDQFKASATNFGDFPAVVARDFAIVNESMKLEAMLDGINDRLPEGQSFPSLPSALFHICVEGYLDQFGEDAMTPTGCWKWRGPISNNRPSLMVPGYHLRAASAARVGFEIYNDCLLARGDRLRHTLSCDLQENCVNPDHLERVPGRSNIQNRRNKAIAEELKNRGVSIMLVTCRKASCIVDDKIVFKFVAPDADNPPTHFIKAPSNVTKLSLGGIREAYTYASMDGWEKKIRNQPQWLPVIYRHEDAGQIPKSLNLPQLCHRDGQWLLETLFL